MVKGLYGGECVQLHHVFITDRGGKNRVAELVDLSEVVWTRVRDDVSEATVSIRGAACAAQAAVLAAIEPKRSEMVIYRGEERVWEGPVNRVGWHAEWVEVNARDVFDYLNGRPLSREWNNNYPNVVDVTERIQTIVNWELTEPFTYHDDDGDPVVIPAWEDLDPPINVLPYFNAHSFPNEARTSALTSPFQMTVGEHIDNYARTGGIDYTVVGRAIHIWDVSRFLGQTRTLTEADFYGEIIVSAYGADHASVAFTVADDGRFGGAGGVATTWKFLQKSGPVGDLMGLPPAGSTPFRPSIADSGQDAWQGYQYWMVYQPTAAAAMRIAASKASTTWVDIADAMVDADSGAGVTVTPGTWPAVAFGYDERLWLFWIEGQNLYRSRSEDGKDWTTKVLIYTAPGGTTLQSPSVSFNVQTQRWTLWFVDTAATPNRIVRMTSTTAVLDNTGQFGALVPVALSLPAGREPWAIEIHHYGSEWGGTVTDTDNGATGTNGDIYMVTTPSATATTLTRAATVAIPRAGAGKHDSLGKGTFYQAPSGNLAVFYAGSLAGVNHVYRSTVTGPPPDIGTGDKNMDYYGPWTKVFTVYDEDDTHSPTQADLNSQAKRNLSGRSPVPIEVRVPDSSGIRLSPGLEIDDLVPGTHMPLLATLNSRQLSQMQKLDKVSVSETAEGENIQVTLLPATKEDADEEEGD